MMPYSNVRLYRFPEILSKWPLEARSGIPGHELALLPAFVLVGLSALFAFFTGRRLNAAHFNRGSGRYEDVPFRGAIMIERRCLFRVIASAVLVLSTGGTATAARALFHYGPGEIAPTGQRISWLGAPRQPVNGLPGPATPVTFQHLYTGRPVTVPR